MKRITVITALLIGLMGAMSLSSCHKHDYPCPGLGQSSEKDFALFGEDGQPKDPKAARKVESNRRISKENGMVNKKSPKRLRAPRKSHI
jgi:hypothetical protein